MAKKEPAPKKPKTKKYKVIQLETERPETKPKRKARGARALGSASGSAKFEERVERRSPASREDLREIVTAQDPRRQEAALNQAIELGMGKPTGNHPFPAGGEGTIRGSLGLGAQDFPLPAPPLGGHMPRVAARNPIADALEAHNKLTNPHAIMNPETGEVTGDMKAANEWAKWHQGERTRLEGLAASGWTPNMGRSFGRDVADNNGASANRVVLRTQVDTGGALIADVQRERLARIQELTAHGSADSIKEAHKIKKHWLKDMVQHGHYPGEPGVCAGDKCLKIIPGDAGVGRDYTRTDDFGLRGTGSGLHNIEEGSGDLMCPSCEAAERRLPAENVMSNIAKLPAAQAASDEYRVQQKAKRAKEAEEAAKQSLGDAAKDEEAVKRMSGAAPDLGPDL